LVVAEKPSVARDLARALGAVRRLDACWEGNGLLVAWALGHLAGLWEPEDYDPALKRWSLASLPIVPQEFRIKPAPGAARHLQALKALMRRPDVSLVVNACDAGREGELIFRWICRLTGCRKPVMRLWLSEATPEAIRAAFSRLRDPRELDGLAAAAEARAHADWLVGINATRALTVRLGELYSVGRVQTPALAMLVEREREIRAFRPEAYWEVWAEFETARGERFRGRWAGGDGGRLPSREAAEALAGRVRGQTGGVESFGERLEGEPPPGLHDLGSLQREANRELGYPAARTLELAQALYEAGLVTYPRTDSRCITEAMARTLPARLRAAAAGDDAALAALAREALASGRGIWTACVDDSKVTDHHAIVPTDRPARGLPPEQAAVYRLVARRFVAAFFPPARWQAREAAVSAGGEPFACSSRVLLEPGWRRCWGQGAGHGGPGLPRLCPGEEVRVAAVDVAGKQTQPPPRHTDATLVRAMERAGLGTPATRAAIIERLLEVGYAERRGRALAATPKGEFLVSVCPGELRSPELTAHLEAALRDVEAGRLAPEKVREEAAALAARVVRHAAGLPASGPARTPRGPASKASGTRGTRARSAGAACRSGGSGWATRPCAAAAGSGRPRGSARR
jgi:DNA topoisomerase-3